MIFLSKAQRRLLLAVALLIGVTTAASAQTAGWCHLYNGYCCEGGGSHFCYTGCPTGQSGDVLNAVAAAYCSGTTGGN